MRIAALDLGTNSFHLLVAEVHPDGSFEAVAREKEVVRLGEAVEREGRISEAAADRAVATVRRLRQLAEAAGATEVIAKATSAIRTAANGGDLVDRIEAEAGVEVDVISGAEEARLIFGAIRASVVIDPGPALCFDLGGGSVELMIGDRAGLLWSASRNLGVGRLAASYLSDDPPSLRDLRLLEEHIRSTLLPLASEVSSYAPTIAVGSSGTLSDLAAIVVAQASGKPAPRRRNQVTVARAGIESAHARISTMTARQRRRLPGLEAARADLIVAGSAFAVIAMDVFALERLTISDWALREGIVLDAVGHHDPEDWSDDPHALRRAAVAGLARRCSSDARHTTHVAALALQLFDATTGLHALGTEDRELLEYAALLHDIGRHVSRKGHHRHAAYLVENGDMRGFAPREIHFLAELVRHQRRGEPKLAEPVDPTLPPDDQERVRRLAAILRIADGLDRGRRQVVDSVTAQIGEELVVLRLTARGDVELEVWGARRKLGLFERVFGRDVDLVLGDAPGRPNPHA